MDILHNARTGEYLLVRDDGTEEPINAAQAAQLKTALETGSGEAALVAAGRTAAGMARSVGQVFGQDWFPEVEQDQSAYGALEAVHPLATTGGEMLPYMIPGGTGLRANVALQSGLAAADQAQGGDWLERAGFAAGGTIAGHVALRSIAGGMQLARGRGAAQQADEMAQAGVRPTYGEQIGNDVLMNIENRYAATNRGGAIAQELTDANNLETGARFLRAFDLPGEMIDPTNPGITEDMLRAARQSVGAQYDEVLDAMGQIEVTDVLAEVGNTMGARSARFRRTYGLGDEGLVAGEEVPARAIRALRQRAMSWLSGGAKATEKDTALDVMDEINDILRDQVDPADLDLFNLANERWRVLKSIATDNQGNVRAGTTANKLRRDNFTGRDPAVRDLLDNIRQRARVSADRPGGDLLGGSQTAGRGGGTGGGGLGALALNAAYRNRGVGRSLAGNAPRTNPLALPSMALRSQVGLSGGGVGAPQLGGLWGLTGPLGGAGAVQLYDELESY